jgi:hypothetical protein
MGAVLRMLSICWGGSSKSKRNKKAKQYDIGINIV